MAMKLSIPLERRGKRLVWSGYQNLTQGVIMREEFSCELQRIFWKVDRGSCSLIQVCHLSCASGEGVYGEFGIGDPRPGTHHLDSLVITRPLKRSSHPYLIFAYQRKYSRSGIREKFKYWFCFWKRKNPKFLKPCFSRKCLNLSSPIQTERPAW